MLVVGLTGNIGSGKSTVTRVLKELGALVLDTDQVARDVVAPGTTALQKITDFFGPQVLNPDGTLNRQQMAAIVFTDDKAREQLNSFVHPEVGKVVRQVIADFRQNGAAPLLVIEVPLLIEGGLQRLMDEVWLVTVDPDAQLARITARDGSTVDARRRIKAQMPQEEKIPLANRIIDNSGDRDATRRQILQLWQEATKETTKEATKTSNPE